MLVRRLVTPVGARLGIAHYLLLFAVTYFPSTSLVAALDPTRHISQYAHTAWRVADGAIDPTSEITQTTDGYVWLGSPNGLLRFDGVKFVRYAPPGLDLPTRGFTFLLGARDGSLWVAMRTGFGRLKDGRFQWYLDPAEHIGVSTILEDHEGTIWVTRYSLPQGEGPLCRVEGNELHCFGEADGIPVRYGLGLTEDKSGDLWFGSTVLCRWRHGSTSTYLNEIQKHQGTGDGVVEVAAGSSGEIWAAVDRAGPELGIRHFSAEKWGAYVIPGLDGTKVRSHALFIDRNQSLWIGTEHDGLYRVHDGMAEHYGTADGLSGDAVEQFYEDHEGDIWVATDGGLDMFRDTSVVTYSMRERLSAAWPHSILALRDDSVWIGTEGAVDILKGGNHSSLAGSELSGFPVDALFQDNQGVVWLGVGGKLMAYEHGWLRRIKNIGKGVITAISEDTNHHVLALTLWGGLFRVENGIVHEILPARKDLPRTGFLAPDREGGVWIGGRTNVLHYYRDGHVDTSLIKGLDRSSTVFSLFADNDNSLWVPTSNGLFRWNNNNWQVLDKRNGLPCEVVFSATRDDVGALWLYSQCGLLKIAQSEFDRWRERSDIKLTVEVFDKSDGALPTAVANVSQPITAKTSDGRLWFLSRRNAQTIDPKQIYRNPLAPPVHIEKIVADHKDYALGDRLRLPALTRDIEIDYTALSLAVPQKVHFRYQLEGHDPSWQDAGTRRQAFYTNLSPGNYRFRVMACNNSGVWNEAGTLLDLSIAPAYYQTIWFRALCLAALLGVVWLLYQVRIQQVRRQEKKLRDVIETMPTFAWTAWPDGSVDFVNRHWQEYTGLSTERTVGSGWQEAAHPEDVARNVEKWRAALATGEPFEDEVRYKRAADGQYRWFLSRAVPLRDGRGKILKWYGTSADIEDRKRAEEEREKLRADLAHVNRVSILGELAASVSHELKQPISAAMTDAKTCLRWLKRELPDVDAAIEATSRIVNDGTRATEIIERLRSLYKKSATQRELVEVNEIIREMVGLLLAEANQYAVSIRADLGADLPKITADRVQLQQVFMNLILNAIEAMKETGGVLTVKTQLAEDGQLLISVSDTGVGLPKEKTEQIFDAFFTTKPQGSGMGLSISRSIVESHGGRLWATANNGPGATFHFALRTAAEVAKAPATGT
ncbi:MAG: two-component regulator propeller domain-containing protein [Candidatus Sulfotelmatobacter sp.]